jgi:hypothetical protein
MMNNSLTNKWQMIGAVCVLGALAACNKAENPADVQQDVASAQAERAGEVADARREGNESIGNQQQDVMAAQRDVNEASAEKNYEVAKAKAEGDYKVAKESCEAMAGDAQKNCKDQAERNYEAAKAQAETLKR